MRNLLKAGLTILGLTFFLVTPVFGFASVEASTFTNCSGCASKAVTILTLTTGDWLICSSATTDSLTTSISSSPGLTWTTRKTVTFATSYTLTEFYAANVAQASYTVTFTFSGTATQAIVNCAAATGTSGFDADPSLPASNSGATPVSVTASTNAVHDLLICLGAGNTNTGIVPGVDCTIHNSGPSGLVLFFTQDWTQLTTQFNSQTETFTETSSNLAAVVDALCSSGESCGNSNLAVVGPCTFFQLQCWWYPLLFMGLYSGFMLFVAQALKVSPKGKAHVFLSALTFGSLIAVILGVMNIVFPLLMLIINTVIVLRLRG